MPPPRHAATCLRKTQGSVPVFHGYTTSCPLSLCHGSPRLQRRKILVELGNLMPSTQSLSGASIWQNGPDGSMLMGSGYSGWGKGSGPVSSSGRLPGGGNA